MSLLLNFLNFQIKLYEKQECIEERRRIARDIYDNFIMKELLAHSHVSKFYLLKQEYACTTYN